MYITKPELYSYALFIYLFLWIATFYYIELFVSNLTPSQSDYVARNAQIQQPVTWQFSCKTYSWDLSTSLH